MINENKYSRRLIKGLLENRAYLNDLITDSEADGSLVVVDFKRALKNIPWNRNEMIILDTLYSPKMSALIAVDECKERYDFSLSKINRIKNRIIDKVEIHMNRSK